MKAKALADNYGVKYYTEISSLLSNETSIDIVAICTPNGLHATHVIQVLRAGYHALVEKPLAISTSDCNAMINEAASHFNVSRERIAEATPYTMKQVNEYLDTPIINSYVTKVLKNETLNDVQRADIINSAAKDVAKDVLGYEVSRDQLALATGYDTNIVNKYLDASNTQVPLAPVSDIRAGKQDQAI